MRGTPAEQGERSAHLPSEPASRAYTPVVPDVADPGEEQVEQGLAGEGPVREGVAKDGPAKERPARRGMAKEGMAKEGHTSGGLAIVALRGVQFWLDFALGTVLTCLPLAAMYLLPTNPEGEIASVILGSAVLVLALALGLLLNVAYWVWLPMRWGGRTPGMLLLRLRVVRLDLGPVSRSHLGLRWLLLLADAMLFGLVGLISMLATPRRQRLGDLMAQTLVVRTTPRPPDAHSAGSAAQPGAPTGESAVHRKP